jgi:hypothetical protein
MGNARIKDRKSEIMKSARHNPVEGEKCKMQRAVVSRLLGISLVKGIFDAWRERKGRGDRRTITYVERRGQ